MRLRLCSAATLVLFLLGCGSTETPNIDFSPKVALAWIKNVEYGGFFAAESLGYYDEVSIQPIFLPGGPNAPVPVVSVVAGKAQIGFSNDLYRLIDAVALGNDLVVLGAQYQVHPGGVISYASKPVLEPEDLVGIRFLGQEGTESTLDTVLSLAGLPVEYSYLPAGYSIDPFVNKLGDAYHGFATNQPITLELKYGLEQGKDFIFTSFDSLGMPSYANLIFCRRAFLEEDFETVVRFLHGSIQGWNYSFANPDYAPTIVVEEHGRQLGLEIEQQKKQNRVQEGFMKNSVTQKNGLFWVDPKKLEEKMYPWLRASGRNQLPVPSDFIDTRALVEAHSRIKKG